MRKPRALAPGDRVAIVAPASPFTREEFDAGLREITRLGFVPVYDDSVFARQRYVAGAPEVRVAAIHAAWRDPSIAGVIGVRGGYGSAQVLPLLDRDEARRAAKPFIGYSDVTSVLTFLTLGCDLVAFHGPMLAGRLGRGADGYDEDSFLRALCRAQKTVYVHVNIARRHLLYGQCQLAGLFASFQFGDQRSFTRCDLR